MGMPTYKTLDIAKLRACCPLDNGRHSFPPPVQSLGDLQVLPLETLIKILLEVDLPSFTNFRCTNRQAMRMADAVPQYDWIFKHYPDVLRAVICAEARSFSCSALYNELQTTECRHCGKDGSHLYLITGDLVCSACHQGWQPAPDGFGSRRSDFTYMPLLRTHIRKHLLDKKIPDDAFEQLPHILSLPVGYRNADGREFSARKRVQLFDYQTVSNKFPLGECRCEVRYSPRDVSRRYQAVIPCTPQ